MKPHIHDFIDNLTAKQQLDLLAGLKQKDLRDTNSLMISTGSLFESYLRTSGHNDFADQVKMILGELLK
jgi:hypothetical protein